MSPTALDGLQRYHVLGEIGNGRSSTVCKGRDKLTGRPVALKFMNKAERPICSCKKEAEMHQLAQGHRNISRVENVIETADQFIIVQEFAPNGDCSTAFQEDRVPQPLSIFADVVGAIEHMHKANIAHLDIKLENILLSKESDALLTDFGHATSTRGASSPLLECACCEQVVEYEHNGMMKPVKGTRAYLAPEALACRGPDEFRQLDYCSLDIWALGVLMHVLLTEAYPWDEAVDASPEYQAYVKTGSLPHCKDLAPEFVLLLRGMLCPAPRFRFTIHDVRSFITRRLSTHSALTGTSTHARAPAGMLRAQSLVSCIVIALVATLVLMFGQKCAPALPSMLAALFTRVLKK